MCQLHSSLFYYPRRWLMMIWQGRRWLDASGDGLTSRRWFDMVDAGIEFWGPLFGSCDGVSSLCCPYQRVILYPSRSRKNISACFMKQYIRPQQSSKLSVVINLTIIATLTTVWFAPSCFCPLLFLHTFKEEHSSTYIKPHQAQR